MIENYSHPGEGSRRRGPSCNQSVRAFRGSARMAPPSSYPPGLRSARKFTTSRMEGRRAGSRSTHLKARRVADLTSSVHPDKEISRNRHGSAILSMSSRAPLSVEMTQRTRSMSSGKNGSSGLFLVISSSSTTPKL